jgi:four helix bundle protein
MSNGKLDEFKAYQKSLELFDMVVNDISQSLQDRRLDRLAGQQLASADSVCSNIEEGYGRESTTEYRRFLIIARGSLRETMGRYKRLRAWLPEEVIKKRVVLAEEINKMLTSTIKSLASK